MQRHKAILSVLLFPLLILSLTGCSDSSGSPGVDRLAVTANANDNSVSILSTRTLKNLGDVPVTGTFPWEVTLSADGSTAYVMCRDSNSISIIDLAGKVELGTIELSGSQPAKAVITADGYLYVAYQGSDFLSVVDIAAAVPAETNQIALTGTSYLSIAATPDGASLYVGGNSCQGLSKVDIETATETSYWGTVDGMDCYIWDIEIDANGLAYLATYSQGVLTRWDTTTDTWADSLPAGQSYEWMNDATLAGDLLIGTYNAGSDNGGIVLIDTTLGLDNYAYDQADDSSYNVELPFTFSFAGNDYDQVTFNSNGSVSFNGYVSYDNEVANITGFAANTEDLDSGDTIFNYSSRVYADRAVFQWATSMNTDELNPNYVSIFEIVLFANGKARFDYLFSMPSAIEEDDSYSYGVGDGSTALVNLRTLYGSPFNLKRRSFLWDPATPNRVTSVAFQWEGTGVLHLPVTGLPHGIAASDTHAFVPLSRDYVTGANSTTVQIYDLRTLLPAGTITVGAGPRAIVIQPPPAPAEK